MDPRFAGGILQGNSLHSFRLTQLSVVLMLPHSHVKEISNKYIQAWCLNKGAGQQLQPYFTNSVLSVDNEDSLIKKTVAF